ncbi:uncharacterized protein ppk17 isoform X2 [Eurosta solidaginis]|uniref:uncharacterized protein ppk17 isoform X2 n=1 Tax=Eurosta solidaginis TaxID=178769 RepID=UPI003530662A
MGYWSELWVWILKDPGKIIRYIVLFVCSIIVVVQNLSNGACPHPKYVTCWNKYPFGELELEEFFTNSTFEFSETFLGEQYGLNGLMKNLEVKSSLHFYMGRCYTLRPLMELKRTTRSTGYSIMLTHHIKSKLENSPGWLIYIHDFRHDFTELSVKGAARIEYVFAEIEQEVEIKLQSQHFKTVKTKDHSCSSKPGYSDTKCAELSVFEDLAAEANCTGPWMYGIPQKSCNSSKAMQKLVKKYGSYYNSDDDIECNCPLPCESRIYSTYIQSRRNLNPQQQFTQIWIYYSTKLVTVIEESYSYDSTQFIADVGGSVGFLLGLSVLGFIGLLEHLALFFCGGIIKKQLQREKYLQEKTKRESQTSNATNSTVDISTVAKMKEIY